jgi:putative flippase GtrA
VSLPASTEPASTEASTAEPSSTDARVRRLVRAFLADHRGRYLLAGGSGAVLYLGMFALGLYLWPHVGYLWIVLLAQAVLISIAFPVYRRFVFRSHGRIRTDFLRFLSVWSGGLFASFVGVPFLVEAFGVPPLAGQVGAVVIVAVLSYLGHRFVSFRQRHAG